MSAAARGAAGYIYMHRARRTQSQMASAIAPMTGDIDALALYLEHRLNVTPLRARQLAEQQAEKTFNRARSGARR